MDRMEACQGVVPQPSLTIEPPFDLWIKFLTRRVDGQPLFMEQRDVAAGDIGLMVAAFNRQNR